MRLARRLIVLVTALLTLVAGMSACGMAAAVTWTPPERAARAEALGRWGARPFTSYRIALRVEALGKVCYQQIEVRGEWVRQTIRNTCDTIWLDTLTVEGLFELSEQIEEIPASRCAPPAQPCLCHRVFTRRGVYYDERLGYPATVLARSELQYNWTSPDFWRRLVEEGALPSCTPARRRLTVQVLALTPLE
ncbi:MAG TPA: hypothetical protein VNL77_16170 [Roseiflexaceae bacterium]|nr:hypothetical protein [Roseiflexaceae bacterium]